LSKQVLNELRAYFTKYRPKVYLFNGRKKGQKISEGAMSHAIRDARKRSGIDREITMHVLRHCFATHCLEHGMYIKRLQMLLGHSSLNTTLYSTEIGLGHFCYFFCPLSSLKNLADAKASPRFFASILIKIKSLKLSQTTFH